MGERASGGGPGAGFYRGCAGGQLPGKFLPLVHAVGE